MTTRETTRDDPSVQQLVASAGAMDRPFDYERAQVVVVGERRGEPIGVASGFVQDGQALFEHCVLRPADRGHGRAILLATALARAFARRGFATLICRVTDDDPRRDNLAALLRLWGADRYETDARGDWWRKRLSEAA